MKTHFFLSLACFIVVCSSMAPASCSLPDNKYNTFDSALVIHIYHGGGMRYESDNIYIRYDSCVYEAMDQGKTIRTATVMTVEKRKQVMGLLKQYKLYELKQDNKPTFAHDKATSQICTDKKGKDHFCISSSASQNVREKDRANFRDLYDQLFAFATGNK